MGAFVGGRGLTATGVRSPSGGRPGLRRRSRRARPSRRRTLGSVIAITIVLAALVVVIVVIARPAVKRLLTPASCTVAAPSGTFVVTLSQARYAATIAAVGERDGMPDHAVSVALATALQESKLADIDYGDRDSLGLFQQRPSEGWGTASQVLDPLYSANAFYDALAKVPNWQDVSVTVAAQDVQHSDDPTAYQRWAVEGRALAEAFTGEAPAALSCSYRLAGATGTSTTGSNTAGSNTADAAITTAVSAELGVPLPDHNVATAKQGWSLASWLVARGEGFGVSEVSFEGWSWTAVSGRWKPRAVPVIDQVAYTTQLGTADP